MEVKLKKAVDEDDVCEKVDVGEEGAEGRVFESEMNALSQQPHSLMSKCAAAMFEWMDG